MIQKIYDLLKHHHHIHDLINNQFYIDLQHKTCRISVAVPFDENYYEIILIKNEIPVLSTLRRSSDVEEIQKELDVIIFNSQGRSR